MRERSALHRIKLLNCYVSRQLHRDINTKHDLNYQEGLTMKNHSTQTIEYYETHERATRAYRGAIRAARRNMRKRGVQTVVVNDCGEYCAMTENGAFMQGFDRCIVWGE